LLVPIPHDAGNQARTTHFGRRVRGIRWLAAESRAEETVDTTLVALVMSHLVKLPTDAMRNTEDGLVTWVDEYCNENFLRCLHGGSEGATARSRGGGMAPAVFQKVVQSNRAQQQKPFEAWEPSRPCDPGHLWQGRSVALDVARRHAVFPVNRARPKRLADAM
jgi:hypothetical protein